MRDSNDDLVEVGLGDSVMDTDDWDNKVEKLWDEILVCYNHRDFITLESKVSELRKLIYKGNKSGKHNYRC